MQSISLSEAGLAPWPRMGYPVYRGPLVLRAAGEGGGRRC